MQVNFPAIQAALAVPALSGEDKPNKPGADWEAMAPYWEQVDTILHGAEAMREAREKYLPRFPNEPLAHYLFRLRTAKFTNVFRDIIEGLASKPFAQELALADEALERFSAMAEDVDGRGNSLHVFAAETFFNGIARAIDWILIDYTRSEGARTVAEERATGARPYWVHVPSTAVIDIRSEVIEGREQLTHVRVMETPARVRQFDRVRTDTGYVVTWRVLEQDDEGEWPQVDQGVITLPEIPMVPFVTGRRIGSKWQFHPPMRDAADLQVELFQEETGLKYIKTMSAFPMLAGNGVTPPVNGDGTPQTVPVGPMSVLYAPPGNDGNHGEWKFIAPPADLLRFLAEDIEKTTKQMRELGRQPLTAQSGNLTKITTAVAAAKGNSAVQMWALGLKDALEQALKYTAMWMNEITEPEVKIFTEFGLDALESVAPELLIKARENGDISGTTLRGELKRYGILSAEFDEDKEREMLLNDAVSGLQQA
jgi:hypothetical protein